MNGTKDIQLIKSTFFFYYYFHSENIEFGGLNENKYNCGIYYVDNTQQQDHLE